MPLSVHRRKRTSPPHTNVPSSKRQKAGGDSRASQISISATEPNIIDAESEDEAATALAKNAQHETAQPEESGEDSDEDAPEAVGVPEAKAELKATASGRERAKEEYATHIL